MEKKDLAGHTIFCQFFIIIFKCSLPPVELIASNTLPTANTPALRVNSKLLTEDISSVKKSYLNRAVKNQHNLSQGLSIQAKKLSAPALFFRQIILCVCDKP